MAEVLVIDAERDWRHYFIFYAWASRSSVLSGEQKNPGALGSDGSALGLVRSERKFCNS